VLHSPTPSVTNSVGQSDNFHLLGSARARIGWLAWPGLLLSNYDLVLSDWKTVGGVKVAHTLTFNLNDLEVAKVTYKEVAANPSIADAAFVPPTDAVKTAAKAPATGSSVPYQWVLRRIALGRFLDADTVFYPPNAPPKMVELGPNVQQVVTGSANNLIVDMKDGLAIFDAPVGEIQSKWVIDAAKAKYPGKPIKYLILTHHHMDHTGGMRTYAAEGATIVVPSPDKAYFEKDLKTTHTVVPDALQKAPKQVEIIEVKDQLTLKDDGGEIRLYRIDNPDVDGMLLGHVVKDNVVWVTDLYSPGRDTQRMWEIPQSQRRSRSSASPEQSSPAVTAATASSPISTPSRRRIKDWLLRAAQG
jgi:Metallo-beta-lactamase superfamily